MSKDLSGVQARLARLKELDAPTALSGAAPVVREAVNRAAATTRQLRPGTRISGVSVVPSQSGLAVRARVSGPGAAYFRDGVQHEIHAVKPAVTEAVRKSVTG